MRSALLLLLLLSGPTALRGQDVLDRVESFARAGRAEEARVHLTEWWDTDREHASREDLQRAIWLRGLLTVDPHQASLEFWRLVVEFPLSPRVTSALERVGRAAAASGDTAGAERAYRMLTLEHPGTPEAERAEAWLASPGRPATPEGGPDAPPGADPGGVERSDAAGPSAPERGDYTVQLGAFSSVVRARDLVERARAAGLGPRVVRVGGSGLVRVRMGRFMNEREARAARERAVDLGFEALVSDGASREEPVGG